MARVRGILTLIVVDAPGSLVQVDRTSQALDVRPDHVETDAAARDIRHLRGGRETGLKDEALDFLELEFGRLRPQLPARL